MSGHPGFCPACFAPLAQEADTCPACGTRITELSARDYREKLVHALFHPLADVRMRAIIALGLRGDAETAEALVECAMRHPTDVVQGLEIIGSLTRMKEAKGGRLALAILQTHHAAHAVREGAAKALTALPNQRECDA